jgi:hypothetical protein
MDRMNEPSGSNALAKWCKSGYLGMAQDDFKAFSALRNKAAHGKLDLFGDDDATKQTSLEKSNRLHNMLNKLVFKLVGYEGPYFDYGRMSVANFKVSK